jgi:hypothetical protein
MVLVAISKNVRSKQRTFEIQEMNGPIQEMRNGIDNFIQSTTEYPTSAQTVSRPARIGIPG